MSIWTLTQYLSNVCVFDSEKKRVLKTLLKLSRHVNHDKDKKAIVDAVLDVFIQLCLKSVIVNDTYTAFADGVSQLASLFPSLVPMMLSRKLAGTTLSDNQKIRLAGIHDENNVSTALASALAYSSNVADLSDLALLLLPFNTCNTMGTTGTTGTTGTNQPKAFINMVCATIHGLSCQQSCQPYNVDNWSHLDAAIETYTQMSWSSEHTPFLLNSHSWSKVCDTSYTFNNRVYNAVKEVFDTLLDQASMPTGLSLESIAPLMSILVFMMTCSVVPCQPLVDVKDNHRFCIVVNMLDTVEQLKDNNGSCSRFVNILNHNSQDLVTYRRVLPSKPL